MKILKTIKEILGLIIGGIIAIFAIFSTIIFPLICIFGIPALVLVLLVKLVFKL